MLSAPQRFKPVAWRRTPGPLEPDPRFRRASDRRPRRPGGAASARRGARGEAEEAPPQERSARFRESAPRADRFPRRGGRPQTTPRQSPPPRPRVRRRVFPVRIQSAARASPTRSGSSAAAPGGKQASRISGKPTRASSATSDEVAGAHELGSPTQAGARDGRERDGRRLAERGEDAAHRGQHRLDRAGLRCVLRDVDARREGPGQARKHEQTRGRTPRRSSGRAPRARRGRGH